MTHNHTHENWALPDETKKVLKKRFEELIDSVQLAVFTKDGENDEFNKLLRKWKKYSKSENIDIYGYEKTGKSIVANND